jgi:Outer membrane receptor proteins, mostly Fe transport
MTVIPKLKILSIFISALLCCFSVSLLAQNDRGTIAGLVTDPAGAVLQGAHVTLTPSERKTVTNENGEFTLTDVPAGSYTLQVSYLGFTQSSSAVTVSGGKTESVRIGLIVASENEQVLVVAERVHGEAEALNRIRTGDNILQVATSEMITSLPNANMADAIGRMPSVTLDRDEGEGAYIQVRGTEPRLTNVTVNGNTIPSEEGGVRQIRLDAVASDLVDSVELNKTLSANQDADGIGGSVNFVTKTASDKPTLILTGLGGFSRIAPGRYVNQAGATAGKRFGADKSLGILGGFSFDFNGRGFDDIEPAFASGGTTYGDLQTREYMYNRSRYGLTGSVDKKLSNSSSVYLKGMFSEFYDYGDKWYYDYIQASAPKFYTSKKSPTYAVSTMSLGGRHFFGPNALHWDLSGSYSWEDAAAGNPKADFSWLPATGVASKINYTIDQTTTPHVPQFTPTNATIDQIQTPSNWVLIDAYTSSGRSGALSLAGAADYNRIHKLGKHYGEFSMGAKVRNIHRGQNAFQYIYDLGGTGAKPSSSISSAYRMTNFLGSFTNPNYYDGAYKFGPVSDFQTIIKNAVNSASPLLLLDVPKTLSKTATSNYNLVERITAGYLMESIDLTRLLHLQFGVRFENTYENGWGYKYVANANTTARTDPGIQSYLDAMPSVQLRFSPTPNDNLRLVYGRGIARPNPLSLIPYINETDGGSNICPSNYSCAGTLSMGNPKLVAEYANNYDVLYERFLRPMGMIQAGFFYKDLSKPLFTTQGVTQYLGQNWATTQPVNGTKAHLMGFEIGFQQHMSYLPGFLGGFGINANYSYTSSDASGIPFNNGGTTTYRSAPLLRQAPHTWNIGPTYDRGRLSLRSGISYNAHNLYAYNSVDPSCSAITCNAYGPAGDQYVYGHAQVDMQGTVRLYKGLNFLAYGQNLTNEPFGYYNGDPKYMIQREFYKQTLAFGLKYYLKQGER